MSNEYNEQIKERCYEQAEWEVNRYLHTLEKELEMEDLIDAKAKELYEKEEQVSFLYRKNWGMNDD
jgi:hypothetical protein